MDEMNSVREEREEKTKKCKKNEMGNGIAKRNINISSSHACVISYC